MSIENSKGKRRLTAPRLSDAPSVDADAARSRGRDGKGRFLPGNKASRGQGGKKALTRSLEHLLSTDGASVVGAEAKAIGAAALAIYRPTMRDLGNDSPLVMAPALRFAVNAALAAYFTERAAEAGFATDRGMALLEQAHRCEKRCDRSSVAALTFAARVKRHEAPALPWLTTGTEAKRGGPDEA